MMIHITSEPDHRVALAFFHQFGGVDQIDEGIRAGLEQRRAHLRELFGKKMSE